jgi:hypothetical protein
MDGQVEKYAGWWGLVGDKCARGLSALRQAPIEVFTGAGN